MPTSRRRLATGLAATAVLATVLVGIAAPTFGADAGRTVTPSKSTELAKDGETITVSGSGFDSTRGIYLMFCKQIGTSGTAEGRPTGADCSGAQAWITGPGIGVPPTGTVAWTGDGTFSTTLSVVGAWSGVDCTAVGTTCGIVTRNDHREAAYDQDTFTPVAFAAGTTEPTEPEEPTEPGAPTYTVTPTTGLDAAGDTVTVTGANIPAGQGVYIRLCKKAAGTVGTAAGRPAAGGCDGDGLWATPTPPPGVELPPVTDGAFSVELPVAGAFDGDSWIDCMTAGSCGVFVRRDHNGGAADYALDGFKPITFDPTTTPPEEPEPEEPVGNDTAITVTPSANLVDGQTVTVAGSGFVAGQGVYVQLCATPTGTLGTSAGRAASCFPEQDGEHVVWVTPIAAGGTFSTPLTVAESFTDAGGNAVDCTVDGACGVFVRRDHNGGTSDYSQDAFEAIAFGDGDPIEPTAASVVADRTTGLDPNGDSITVEGANFRPDDPIFVALCDSSVPNFAACDYQDVVEVTPAPSTSARALGDPGTFSVDLAVRATFGDSTVTDCLAIDTCAIQTWSVSGSNADAEVTLPVSFAAASNPILESTPDPTTPVGSGTLARTGWSPWPLTTLALSLLVVGAGLTLAGRRRTVRA